MTTRKALGEDSTHSIIGAFYAVYNALGFGLLESVYSAALQHELRARGHWVDREFWVDVVYRGEPVAGQRIDLLVDRQVVLEVKASEELPRFARRQLLSYLTCTHLELGLILHFGPEPKFYRMVSTNAGPREPGPR